MNDLGDGVGQCSPFISVCHVLVGLVVAVQQLLQGSKGNEHLSDEENSPELPCMHQTVWSAMCCQLPS